MKREIINCDCCGSEIPNSPEAYRGEFKYSLPFHSRGETTIEQGELSDICMKCTNKIKAFIENISAHEQSRQAAVSGSVCQHEFYDKDQDFIANQCVKCGEPKHTN